VNATHPRASNWRDTNIFVRKYETTENQWTEALVKLLANADDPVLGGFLELCGLRGIQAQLIDTAFVLQEVGPSSVPDAAFWSQTEGFKMYLEVKTGYDFSPAQLQGHLEELAATRYHEKALVLLSNSLVEPEGFGAFKARNLDRGVTISAVSWSALSTWVRAVADDSREGRVSFLAKQFSEYLDGEVRPSLPWSGFSADFDDRWHRDPAKRTQAEKLVSDPTLARVVTDHLGPSEHPAKIQPGSLNEVRMRWHVNRAQPYFDVYVVVSAPNVYAGEAVVAALWWWDDGVAPRVERRTDFGAAQRQLQHEGFQFRFEPARHQFFKCLPVTGLAGRAADEQKRRVLGFVSEAMDRVAKTSVVDVIVAESAGSGDTRQLD
jgi:hypothetical protein